MIGRKKETQELIDLYDKNKAELVAIYGRRRVGKTYLVDETFKGRITFRHSGLAPMEENSKKNMKMQLDHFYNNLRLQGMKNEKKPSSWLDAFFLLEKHLQSIDDKSRQIVFLDELPWLDTPKSGFLQAFEAFWNSWGCHRNNLMVIVCVSSNSWILDNLINNYGGLYNRVTHEIKLSPFTLKEEEEYFKENSISLSRYDIVQSEMILGGIPYYMSYFKANFSLAQNIDNIFFTKGAKLENEYDRLFSSIFSDPIYVKNIIELLSTKSIGYTRSEIVKNLKISDGARLSKYLNSLIANDFILKYTPFSEKKREVYYKLIDSFCLFYLRFIHNQPKKEEEFYQHNVTSQTMSILRGYAFENLCFKHILEIKKALGISGVITSVSSWQKKDGEATQIDLLITRNDNVINMCELKFYSEKFLVNKEYYQTLLKRQDMLLSMVDPKTAIHSTLITTFGLERNEYSSIFTDVITLDDLFA